MEDTKIWASLALPAEAKAGIDDPREMERQARSVEDVAHRRWLVSDDPDEHIEQLRPYLELGFNHLVFHAPGEGQKRFLELYGSQILPRIRDRWVKP
jgi:coenzyme F420-dependent glucose-6-phosphate dehydrogenase